mmetsp:Transcript_78519/g.173910  ORF Transcript_78519/g.173910 Transcript_78519/m.173910 type:complete len:111 (-) Transcript_78519:79-411(-)
MRRCGLCLSLLIYPCEWAYVVADLIPSEFKLPCCGGGSSASNTGSPVCGYCTGRTSNGGAVVVGGSAPMTCLWLWREIPHPRLQWRFGELWNRPRWRLLSSIIQQLNVEE